MHQLVNRIFSNIYFISIIFDNDDDGAENIKRVSPYFSKQPT